jgi:tRNA pseudouridine38-40 synthase
VRYFFEIAYSGTHYHGWQNQANALSVQQVVEDALTKLLRHKISITGSGRTDTGVHCVQQFFHADVEKEIHPGDLQLRLNTFLPRDIVIRAILPVKPDAHARYDARRRAYEYRITRTKNPFLYGYSYYLFREPDVAAMNKAASRLLGSHDFQCFSKVKTDVNHFECEVFHARWSIEKDLLVFAIEANRFLRGMVRAIVGTLLDVGTGKISIADFGVIIASKNRKKAGANVPAEGLFLTSVKYPKRIFIQP